MRQEADGISFAGYFSSSRGNTKSWRVIALFPRGIMESTASLPEWNIFSKLNTWCVKSPAPFFLIVASKFREAKQGNGNMSMCILNNNKIMSTKFCKSKKENRF